MYVGIVSNIAGTSQLLASASRDATSARMLSFSLQARERRFGIAARCADWLARSLQSDRQHKRCGASRHLTLGNTPVPAPSAATAVGSDADKIRGASHSGNTALAALHARPANTDPSSVPRGTAVRSGLPLLTSYESMVRDSQALISVAAGPRSTAAIDARPNAVRHTAAAQVGTVVVFSRPKPAVAHRAPLQSLIGVWQPNGHAPDAIARDRAAQYFVTSIHRRGDSVMDRQAFIGCVAGGLLAKPVGGEFLVKRQSESETALDSAVAKRSDPAQQERARVLGRVVRASCHRASGGRDARCNNP